MKKRFTDESDKYNELMHNVLNSNILSENIISFLESNIRGSVNASRRDAVMKKPFDETLKSEDDSMVFYNHIKKLFEYDNLLSDKYKTYILDTILELMEEKHKAETERVHGTK